MLKPSLFACLLGLAAGGSLAEPAPLNPVLFAFPGAGIAPSSARSAGLALADRWLGDQPFDNPAASPGRQALVSPVLQRVSRQDLRAANRHFDEQTGFFDAGGAWASVPVGRLSLGLYAFQPVRRLEDNAFERGERGAPVEPAVIQTRATSREVRTGLAASLGLGWIRVGAAGEWLHRQERYASVEKSGSPDAGNRSVEFSGDGAAFQAGARLDWRAGQPGALAVGAALRYLPSLALDGDQSATLVSGDTLIHVSARREAGWEGGISARCAASPAFLVIASVGARTPQQWRGLDVTSGDGASWSLGGEYHDVRDPWAVRFGVGGERQSGVPESSAGLVGLGFAWKLEGTSLDLGVMRRSIERASSPTSFEDHLVGSVGFAF